MKNSWPSIRNHIIDPGNAVERDHPLNARLVSWWMAPPGMGSGGRLQDLMGVNHGTLMNGASWVSGRNGIPAPITTGTQYVNVPTSPLFVFPSVMAVEMFFNCPVAPSLNQNWLSFDASSGGSAGYLRVRVGTGTTVRWQSGGGTITGTTAIAANTDYHAVITRDGGNTVRVFLNGVREASGSASGSIGTGLPFQIGAFTGATEYLAAIYYSVRLYAADVSGFVPSLYQQATQGYPDLIRRQPTSRSFIVSGGGGGGSFSPAWARGSNVVLGGAF